MKAKAIFIITLMAISIGAICASSPLVTANIGKNVKASAKDIGMDFARGKYLLKGSARIKSTDEATHTSFDAKASKILVNALLAGEPKGKGAGLGAIKNATMTGPVEIVYVEFVKNADYPDGTKVVTTATANSASYDGATQLAQLVGNVKIVSENPSMFQKPSVMTGDKAIINLKPDLGEDEMRYRLESTSGVSTMDITPTPQAKKVSK